MRLTEKRQTVGVSAGSAGKSTGLRLVFGSIPPPPSSSDATQYRARGPLSLMLILVQQTVCRRRRSSHGGVRCTQRRSTPQDNPSLRSIRDGRPAVSYRLPVSLPVSYGTWAANPRPDLS